MTDNNKEISTEQDFIFSDEQFDKMAAEQKAERMKSLRRHKLPAKLTLEASLNALTKSELEDIQYNLKIDKVNKNYADFFSRRNLFYLIIRKIKKLL